MAAGHHVEAAVVEQHIRVEVNGQVVAETQQPVLLKETGLPDRWYIPPADVRLDLFDPSDLRTTCPFKGEATYWTLRDATNPTRNIAWTYPDPLPTVSAIKDHLAFYDRHATVTALP
ncbi:DUF427 domain-containing protein [Streptomyces sp. NPDC049881]|uniref:DUF427 domain-containing protein n=1 Tax=Streptomyces sp. NPDC049881 TaxID=3155778 RepID=UPI0034222479